MQYRSIDIYRFEAVLSFVKFENFAIWKSQRVDLNLEKCSIFSFTLYYPVTLLLNSQLPFGIY